MESAMVLTEEEWEDLAAMAAHYRQCTDWLLNSKERNDEVTRNRDHVLRLERMRRLASRIIDAAEE